MTIDKIEKVFLEPVHYHAYRRPNCENPLVTGVCKVTNGKYQNMCLEVTYEDGFVDYVPMSDVNNGDYKLRW